MKEILPLFTLVAAIVVASALGDLITKKTGKRTIGWSIGIVIFLLLMALSGALLGAELNPPKIQ